MDIFCGLDFGTSNSVVSVLNCQVPQTRSVIREPSVLYFPKQGICDSTHFVGNEAIKQYLRHNMEGRFIQSLKTLLSDEEFKPTLINKRPYRPDDLVALIILEIVANVVDPAALTDNFFIDSGIFNSPISE